MAYRFGLCPPVLDAPSQQYTNVVRTLQRNLTLQTKVSDAFSLAAKMHRPTTTSSARSTMREQCSQILPRRVRHETTCCLALMPSMQLYTYMRNRVNAAVKGFHKGVMKSIRERFALLGSISHTDTLVKAEVSNLTKPYRSSQLCLSCRSCVVALRIRACAFKAASRMCTGEAS